MGVELTEVSTRSRKMGLETHPDLPKGAYPCFLSGKTQEICGVVQDEDVTEEVPYKAVPIEDIKQDIFKRAAVCDFSPFKDLINSYKGDTILVVYDVEFAFGRNFYVALTPDAAEEVMKQFVKEEEKPAKKEKLPKKKKVMRARTSSQGKFLSTKHRKLKR